MIANIVSDRIHSVVCLHPDEVIFFFFKVERSMWKSTVAFFFCMVLASHARKLHQNFYTPVPAIAVTAAPKHQEQQSDRIKLFLNNNIPEIQKGCTGVYICKKKAKTDSNVKPCLKYCLKKMECDTGTTHGKPDQCVELYEDAVFQDTSNTTDVSVMQVNMIDFPCQPGYLPDSRGRCREVW